MRRFLLEHLDPALPDTYTLRALKGPGTQAYIYADGLSRVMNYFLFETKRRSFVRAFGSRSGERLSLIQIGMIAYRSG